MEKELTMDNDTLLERVVERISGQAGGRLDEATMQALTAEEITVWGFWILRNEVMDGGFIQLIYNGYGPFFFCNPFAKAMRLWGLKDLAKLINKAKDLYRAYGAEIAKECSDEEFMALYEAFPKFDDLDDDFVMNEEEYTAGIAEYVRTNMSGHIASLLEQKNGKD